MKGKCRKTIALLLVLLMVFNMGIGAFAEGDPSSLYGGGGPPVDQQDLDIDDVGNDIQGDEEPPAYTEPDGGETSEEPEKGEEATVEQGEGEQELPGESGGGEQPGEPVEDEMETPAEPEQEQDGTEKLPVEVAYEIQYLLLGTGEPVEGLVPIVGTAEVGTIIEIPHPEIEGYQVAADQPTSFVISENEELNKVVVYYEVVEEVEEVAENVNLTSEVDGITITVSGDAGVIPEDTVLSVKQLSDTEVLDYVEAIRENEGVELEEYLAFDITLQDKDGNQIQPNGEVTVSFSGIDFSNETDEVMVYHVEPDENKESKPMTFDKSMAFGMLSFSDDSTVDDESTDGITVTNMSANVNNGIVRFSTDHFSIYIVGTNQKHENSNNRYEMYIGDTVELEERDRAAGGTWSITNSGRSNRASITQNYAVGNLKAKVSAIAEGDVTVRYRVGNQNSYFYITIKNQYKESYDQLTPAREPIPDPDKLLPGTVAASKTAKWVDYNNRIAEIELSVEGMPIITGSDVILVMDVSGSMSTNNRINTAKQASKKFINYLLGNSNYYNNRVAFIPFQGQNGGSGNNEVRTVTAGSVNFSYDIDRLSKHIDATTASGGTNYTAALQKAINYANSRLQTERTRPLYVVFMSDGAPGAQGNSANDSNWNGTSQARTLKNNYNATIYTIGIQLDKTGTQALRNISSTVDGVLLYKAVSNMDDLQPVLEEIGGEIKKAGTNAVFRDYISQYFNYYSSAPYISDGTYDENSKVVTIEVGDILESPKKFKIYVRLKDDYWLTEQDYPTNSNIILEYTDVNDEPADKDKDELGDPEVSVGYGTIKVKYVLVNDNGQYIDLDGKVVGEAYRVFVPTNDYYQDYSYNGSTRLEVGQTYDVEANVPQGYSLYSGESSSKRQELTIDNRNAVVEFKVVASTEVEYTVNYLEKGTDRVLALAKTATGTLGTEVTEDAIDIPGYNKVAPTTVTITLAASGNVINFYYTARTDIEYVVNYLEKDTNKVLAEQKRVTGKTFGTEVTEDAIDIPGYNKVAPTTVTITLAVSGNVINFYYTARTDIEYVVNYLEQGTDRALAEQKRVTGQTFGTQVTENAIDIEGYNKVEPTTATITLAVSGNVINFYYTARTDIEYVVNYLEQGTDRALAPAKTGTGTFGTEVTENAIDIPGYNKVEPTTATITLAVSGNVINFYYTARTDIEYVVNYLEQGTDRALAEQKRVTGQTFGTQVTENAIDIPGYNKVEPTTATITLAVSGNVINFYYTARTDIEYVVNYLEQGTDRALAPAKTGTGTFGTEVTENAIDIEGYNKVEPTTATITLAVSGNVINFYYTARTDIEYVVNYLEQGTDRALAPAKTGTGTFGTEVTEYAIDIEGYNKVEPTTATITLAVSGNVINFYYTARTDIEYVVNYLEQGTDRALAPAKTGTGTFGTEVTENAIDIEGYNKVEPTTATITLAVSGNVINFYYTARTDIEYVVNYLEQGTDRALAPAKTGTGTFGTEVTEYAIDIEGYNKVEPTTATITLAVSGNVINFYYTARTDIEYVVNYLEQGTDRALAPAKTGTGTFGTEVTENAIDIPGYNKVEPTTATITLAVSGNVINFYYTARTDIEYVVNYLEQGTDRALAEQKRVTGQTFGTQVTENAIDIEGYNKVEPTTATITLAVSGNVINFYYTARTDIEYVVNYLEQGTDRALAPAKTGTGTFGTEVTENAIDIEGYNKVEPTTATITLAVSGNVINFYYTARTDITYTVYYLEKGTGRELAPPKKGTGTLGTEVTEYAIDISGYNKVAPIVVKLLLDKEEENVIRFYYTASSRPSDRDDDDDDDDDDRPSRPTTPTVVEIPDEEIPAGLPQLNREEHFQYIQGYPDGTVKPLAYITRDEVAAVFYRLLDRNYRESIKTDEHNFSDVAADRWSNRHIATLANGGIVTGYEDGTFRPGNYITRAEMAIIASRFDKLTPVEGDMFTDIAGHWANKYINSAAAKGWVKGYPDGTFRPDQYITRAEFVTLVNNVLGRKVTKGEILPDAKTFPDLPEDAWYYEAMMEAVNSHYYYRLEDGTEDWTEIYYPELDM